MAPSAAWQHLLSSYSFRSIVTVFVYLLIHPSSVALLPMEGMSDDESATSSVIIGMTMPSSLFDIPIASDDIMTVSSMVLPTHSNSEVVLSDFVEVTPAISTSYENISPTPSQGLETSSLGIFPTSTQKFETSSPGFLISSPRVLISSLTPTNKFETSFPGVLISSSNQEFETSSPGVLISSPTPTQKFETSSSAVISSPAPTQEFETSSPGVLISSLTPTNKFETSSSEVLISSHSQGFKITPSPAGFEILSSSSQDLIETSFLGILTSVPSPGLKIISSPSQEFKTSLGVLISSPSPDFEIISSHSQTEISSLFFSSLFETSSLEIFSSSPPQPFTEMMFSVESMSFSSSFSIAPTSSTVHSLVLPLFTSSIVFLASPTPTATITEDITLYLRFDTSNDILIPLIPVEIKRIVDTVIVDMCKSVPSSPSTMKPRVECILMIDPSANVNDIYVAIVDGLVAQMGQFLIEFSNISSLRGFCDYETTFNDSIGEYLWEETEVGSTAIISCSFGPPDGNAMRVCDFPHLWKEIMVDACFTIITQTFSNLNNSLYNQIENLSIESLQSFSSTLSSLSSNASTVVDQNSINVNVVVGIVRATGQFFTTNNSRSIDSQMDIIQIMSDFIQTFEIIETWPESVIQGTGSDLTLSLNELVNGLALQTELEGFGITGNTISSRLVKQNSSKTVTFIAESTVLGVSSSVMDGSVNIIGNTTRMGAIVLDTALDTDYYLNIYRDDSLFVSSNNTVLSIIMDLSTATTITLPPSDISVYITFLVRDMKSTSSIECVFWDRDQNQGLGDWSTRGCRTISNTKEHVLCQCNHLTAFAAILGPKRPPPPPPPLRTIDSSILPSSLVIFTSPSVSPTSTDDPVLPLTNARLVIVSCVGIAVCMGLLFVTMISLLIFKSVRSKSSSIFHCQLSLSVFCLQMVLIVGVNSTENVTGCVIVGVLLHYFILTSWTWFFAEMAHLLLKTYIVFYKSSYKYLAIFSMFCWGIPIIVVAVTIALSSRSYINETDGYCFICTFPLFIATVMIPVGLLLSLNLLMLILILLKLGIYRKVNHERGKSVYSNQRIIKDMIAITGSMVLFVITAGLIIVHFVGIVQQSFMQMVFASSCIIFGMYLFCFFVLASSEARQGWKMVFKKISCKSLRIRKTYSYDVQNLNRTDGHGECGGLHRAKPYEMSTVTVLSSNSLDEVINETTTNNYEVVDHSTGDTPASRYIVSRGGNHDNTIHSDAASTVSRHSSIIQPTPNTPDYYIEVIGEIENDKSSRVIRRAQAVDSDDFVVFTPIGLPVQENRPPELSISTSDIVVIDNKYSEDNTDSVADDDAGD